MMTNASYQPHFATIIGTRSGVASAPMFVPELKIPVASARSFFGNHSATLLIAAHQAPELDGAVPFARGGVEDLPP